jgi:hypothetical protein
MLKTFGNNELEALRLEGRIHTSLSSLSVLLSCQSTSLVLNTVVLVAMRFVSSGRFLSLSPFFMLAFIAAIRAASFPCEQLYSAIRAASFPCEQLYSAILQTCRQEGWQHDVSLRLFFILCYRVEPVE